MALGPQAPGDQAAPLDGYDEIAPSGQEEVLWPCKQGPKPMLEHSTRHTRLDPMSG